MNDPSIAELLKTLVNAGGSCLWLADENHRDALAHLRPHSSKVTVVTNRFDLAERARAFGLTCEFSDWQFIDLPNFDHIFLRACKEKPVNLHLLQQAFIHLNQHGTLSISGEKQEGIKSLAQQAADIFGHNARLEKMGNAYTAHFDKVQVDTPPPSTYHQMQMIGEWQQQPLYSKPGIYGWNKIDQGSALLIAQLPKIAEREINGILDLGCGYGLLTIAARHLESSRRVATDNNAAALLCTEYNARVNNLAVEVIAGDCADTVDGKFELVLCNPPFHRGFDVDGDLTQHFLRGAQQKLAPGGKALFVVNSFIPIEKKLQGLFRRIQTLENNRQFKVLALET